MSSDKLDKFCKLFPKNLCAFEINYYLCRSYCISFLKVNVLLVIYCIYCHTLIVMLQLGIAAVVSVLINLIGGGNVLYLDISL